jgi:3'-5' exoribonuclease
MNKLADAHFLPPYGGMEYPVPLQLSSLPTRFRVAAVDSRPQQKGGMQYTVDLYHARKSIKVQWTNQPVTWLKPGVLVSPRWNGRGNSAQEVIPVSRLARLDKPESHLNLFETVPQEWVEDRALVRKAAALIEELPSTYRLLFNAILWDGDRFRRFCTGRSSQNSHHIGISGNLAHTVEVATNVAEYLAKQTTGNRKLAILAALLHDAGKADEYVSDEHGRLGLSDRGVLLGHGTTVVEWIAAARKMWTPHMPRDHYEALLHCLTAKAYAPAGLGIRKPVMLEADVLSHFDRLSGKQDLYRRNVRKGGGWGTWHRHLRMRPFSLPYVQQPPELIAESEDWEGSISGNTRH